MAPVGLEPTPSRLFLPCTSCGALRGLAGAHVEGPIGATRDQASPAAIFETALYPLSYRAGRCRDGECVGDLGICIVVATMEVP